MTLRSDSRLLNLIEQRQAIEEVKSIVKSQNLYNAVTSSNNTLLHYAAQAGNREILQYLIDSGCIVDPQNFLGQTPLMVALDSDEESVQILVKAGANIYKRNLCGVSALQMVGSRDGKSNHFLDLFFRRVQSDSMNDIEWIARKLLDAKWILPKVVLLRNIDLMKIMLQRGCDVNATDDRGQTALHVAIMIADIEIAKFLLDNTSVNVNAVDSYGQAPLSCIYPVPYNLIANDDQLDILKLLVDRGADLTKGLSSKKGPWPVIYQLLSNGNREAIEWLLQSDVRLSQLLIRDINRNSLAHLLAQNENPDVIELLHGKICNLNARNDVDETPLIIAATRGVPHAVKFLIDEGADIEARDMENLTALAHAVSCRQASTENVRECIQILLEYGANAQIVIDGFAGDPDRTILDTVEEEDFQLCEPVLSHLALQEAQGTVLTEPIRSRIYSHDLFKIYFERSQQQLKVEIHQSKTLFDFLTENDKNIERYARNQKFCSKLKDVGSEMRDFHYFRSLLRERISKAIYNIEMREDAAHVICKIMKTDYKRFPIIADEIVIYLEQKDMNNLLDAFF